MLAGVHPLNSGLRTFLGGLGLQVLHVFKIQFHTVSRSNDITLYNYVKDRITGIHRLLQKQNWQNG